MSSSSRPSRSPRFTASACAMSVPGGASCGWKTRSVAFTAAARSQTIRDRALRERLGETQVGGGREPEEPLTIGFQCAVERNSYSKSCSNPSGHSMTPARHRGPRQPPVDRAGVRRHVMEIERKGAVLDAGQDQRAAESSRGGGNPGAIPPRATAPRPRGPRARDRRARSPAPARGSTRKTAPEGLEEEAVVRRVERRARRRAPAAASAEEQRRPAVERSAAQEVAEIRDSASATERRASETKQGRARREDEDAPRIPQAQRADRAAPAASTAAQPEQQQDDASRRRGLERAPARLRRSISGREPAAARRRAPQRDERQNAGTRPGKKSPFRVRPPLRRRLRRACSASPADRKSTSRPENALHLVRRPLASRRARDACAYGTKNGTTTRPADGRRGERCPHDAPPRGAALLGRATARERRPRPGIPRRSRSARCRARSRRSRPRRAQVPPAPASR